MKLRPAARSCPEALAESPGLTAAWQFSAARYRQISEALQHVLPDFVACAAVSGSLARMEAHHASDIDLLLVIDDRQQTISRGDAQAAFHSAWDRLDQLDAVRPKSGGIFSVCARWNDLIDPTVRGKVDESITTFGHRIQLLMDSQPVLNPTVFESLQRQILSWYQEPRLAGVFAEPGPYHWLWQDVQRYWRSLRSRTCWLDAEQRHKSLMLNVKLRSSRLLLVAGFLLTLQQSQAGQQQADLITDSIVTSLRQTPVERLTTVSPAARSLTEAWDQTWTFLRDSADQQIQDIPAATLNSVQQLNDQVRQTVLTAAGDAVGPWLL